MTSSGIGCHRAVTATSTQTLGCARWFHCMTRVFCCRVRAAQCTKMLASQPQRRTALREPLSGAGKRTPMVVVRLPEYASASGEEIIHVQDRPDCNAGLGSAFLTACGTTTFTSTWKAPGATRSTPSARRLPRCSFRPTKVSGAPVRIFWLPISVSAAPTVCRPIHWSRMISAVMRMRPGRSSKRPAPMARS